MVFRKRVFQGVALVLATAVLAGCATFGPPGPTRPAFIGTGKTPTQFYQDDANCRATATARAGDPAQVQQSQAASAVFGTLLGAALGAAIGGAASGGRGAGLGAAIGGGAGAATGIGGGTAQAQADAARIQYRWDAEYLSCMYAAGHQVPGAPAPAAHPAPAYAPPPPPPPPSTSPCKPTGKYVRTPQGFVPECE